MAAEWRSFSRASNLVQNDGQIGIKLGTNWVHVELDGLGMGGHPKPSQVTESPAHAHGFPTPSRPGGPFQVNIPTKTSELPSHLTYTCILTERYLSTKMATRWPKNAPTQSQTSTTCILCFYDMTMTLLWDLCEVTEYLHFMIHIRICLCTTSWLRTIPSSHGGVAP